MKLRHAFAATLVLFACLAARPVQDDSYTLNWKPSAGQTLNYALSLDMTSPQGKANFLGDMEMKVTKVETNGDYTLQTSRKNLRVVVDGEEHAIPDEDKPSVQIYNSKGEQIGGDKDEAEEADPVSAVLDAVGDFSAPDKPVKKGDKWSHEIKADEKKAIKAAKVDYEVTGREQIGGVDVVTVSMSYKQTEGSKPTTFDGTISFDVKDMSLVQTEASVRDVPLDEDTTGDMKVKLKRS